jgi:hypothetical protein
MKAWSAEVEHDNGPPEDQPSLRLATRSGVPGLVATFATEAPGGDLFALPHDAQISVASFGRLIAGLAETLLFFESYPAIDDADRRARLHETTQLLSLAGLIQSDHDGGAIAAPPALFLRIARTLTTVAELTENSALADALHRDATRARTAAMTADDT